MYTYEGIQKISFEKVKKQHEEGSLTGCLKLYPDNTECYIEDYSWEEIEKHMDAGGEIGYEC